MHLKFTVILTIALSLTGCSYQYELKAIELNGKIAFVPMKDKGAGCFSRFVVTSETGEVVWKLDADRYIHDPCENNFPIIYGSVPRGGMAEIVKAKPLQAGIRYKIEGWDGDSYTGAFSFRQGIVVDNLEDAH
ncbi:hypothetical protein SAMN06295912_102120 [Sphingomonas laterariae]|uniref:Lipoprotein n=1 Tax=Edaphosphingomonas laterariae TaxID=861865 RepID=A0A239CE69_9SPHN|nr:hypothetical protein [Sphingomonas laterariae]SNS17653.1 hypothetical protein SAMN06295912_102120 [Sphingomonas laterariae]